MALARLSLDYHSGQERGREWARGHVLTATRLQPASAVPDEHATAGRDARPLKRSMLRDIEPSAPPPSCPPGAIGGGPVGGRRAAAPAPPTSLSRHTGKTAPGARTPPPTAPSMAPRGRGGRRSSRRSTATPPLYWGLQIYGGGQPAQPQPVRIRTWSGSVIQVTSS